MSNHHMPISRENMDGVNMSGVSMNDGLVTGKSGAGGNTVIGKRGGGANAMAITIKRSFLIRALAQCRAKNALRPVFESGMELQNEKAPASQQALGLTSFQAYHPNLFKLNKENHEIVYQVAFSGCWISIVRS
jgi:hypothetical protein